MLNSKKIAHIGFCQFGLISFNIARSLFAFMALFFFLSVASCNGSYDEQKENEIIEQLSKGNFEVIDDPNPTVLKKIKNTRPGALYFIGLYLKTNPNTLNKAKFFFNYAYKNEETPYRELARDELFYLSTDEEKIEILDEIILSSTESFKQKDEAKENKEKILRDLQKLENQKQEFDYIAKAEELVSQKKYNRAWHLFETILIDRKNYANIKERNILSAIGKSALFGSKNYAQNALLFYEYLIELEKQSFNPRFENTQKYIFAFYSARLFVKAGGSENIDKGVELFKIASKYASSDEDYDIAIWYILDILKSKDFYLFFDALCKYAPSWKNGYVFERTVADTCMKLVSTKDIKRFQQFKQAIKQTNLVEAQARNSYILTKLASITSNNLSDIKKEKIFTAITTGKHNFLYYKIMAQNKLNQENLVELFNKKYRRNDNRFKIEMASEVLNGLIKYKLYNHLYLFILKYYQKISLEEATKIAKILFEKKYYSESIKVINFATKSQGKKITKEHLKLIYPRPYLELVKNYSKEYKIPEYLIFGLIRSESFFKEKVISRAGAIGLMQLMKPTAKDIARRLKIADYDLTDPDTSIKFGAYYISQMIKRNNDEIISSLASYNAGPNAVKRWKRTFSKYDQDLFLEAIPYTETRGYCRKVFTSSAIYAKLYYNKTYTELVDEFFKK